MKESLSQQTANLKHKNNRHKRWKGIVSILACMVVFCTVYALILPALTAEGTPHCGKEEHTHTEDCYEKKLICGKEEGEGAHHHTDECYREEPVLVCTTPESDGHQHTDDCYTEEKVLTCTNTDPDHVHNDIDGCYTTERKLTCGKEEGEGAHHHTEECYETKRELICGQEENDGHKHTDDCYKKELVCGKEEHKHILACYSDPNADVEDGNVWQRTVSSVTLTGNWGADLAAIAQTQNGYTESTANYAVAEDGQTIHGYTRYGAWANDPYRDNWSAQFADFCLSYAGVPTSAVPQNSDCSAWNYTIPDGYTPKTGDLLLLDTDSNGSADHAGIVTSVSDSTLTAIVGDADKAVRNNTYNIGSETIKGYVSIPENPALATPTPEPTKEPEVTPEAQPTQEPEATPEVTGEPTQEPENKADDAADNKADENKTQDEDVKEDDGKKDDTANNEVTPTPIPTPELAENQFTATLYTDSSYSAEMENQNPITVSGQLPVNAEVKAYPVENLSMENEEIIYAWDISIFDENGNLWEPENGNAISVEFQIPEETEEDSSYSIYYVPEAGTEQKPEEVASQISGDAISFEAEHFSVYALVRKAKVGNGIDFSQYITHVIMQKLNGNGWEDAKEFTDGDNIKVSIDYEFKDHTMVTREHPTISYKLPSGVKPNSDLSGLVSGVIGTKEYDNLGHYEITSDGQINITFNETFFETSGVFNGNIQFSGKASLSHSEQEEEVSFKVGGDTFTIKPKAKDNDLSVNKSASQIDANGNIEYTIVVTSKNGTDGKKIQVKDTLSFSGLDPDRVTMTQPVVKKGSQTVTYDSDKYLTRSDNANKYKYFEISDLPALEAGESYTITYTANYGTVKGNGEAYLNNKAEGLLYDGHNYNWKSSSEIKTNISRKMIEKSSQVIENNSMIKWTITVNPDKLSGVAGGYSLSDILNNENLTISDCAGFEIHKQDSSWNWLDVTATSYDKATGKLTIEDGCTYYISYQTPVDSTAAPGTKLSYVNNATIEKDGKSFTGEKGESVTVPDVVKKQNDSVTEINPNISKAQWTTTINLASVANGNNAEITDTILNSEGNPDATIHYTTMELLKSMKLSISKKDGTTEILNSDRYELICYDQNGIKIADANSTTPVVKFVVTVKNKTINESVLHIAYPTLMNTSVVAEGGTLSVKNQAQIGSHKVVADASYTRQISLMKYAGKNNGGSISYDTNSSGSYSLDYDDTNGKLYYRVVVKPTQAGNLSITDTLPDGVTLRTEDVQLKFYKDQYNVYDCWKNDSNYLWKLAEHSVIAVNGGTLTVTISDFPQEIIDDSDKYGICINYAVSLDENFWNDLKNSTKDYTNVVKWNGKTETQTTTVNRHTEVIEKGGEQLTSVDGKQVSNTVRYYVTINPAGLTLNNKKNLTLNDKITQTDGMKVELDVSSVKLFNYDKAKESDHYKGAELNSNSFTFQYENQNNSFTVVVPDATPCVLQYDYVIENFNNKRNATFKNTAELSGTEKKKTSKDISVKEAESSSTVTKNSALQIIKVDSQRYQVVLDGAKFALSKYENNTWTTLSENYVTGSADGTEGTGSVYIPKSELVENTLYVLREIKAPANYSLSTKGYYFVWLGDGKTADNWYQEHQDIKDSVDGQKNVDKSDIYFIEGKAGTIYIPNRYSKLEVQKNWLNKDGSTIANPPSSINVKLIRQTQKKVGYSITFKRRGSNNNLTEIGTAFVAQNGSAEIRINDGGNKYRISYDGSDHDITDKVPYNDGDIYNQRWHYVITDITHDMIVTVIDQPGWADMKIGDYTEAKYENVDKQIIETVPLTEINGWKYSWTIGEGGRLSADEQGNPYYYSVEEVVPSGYDVTYSNNDGIESGQISITNWKDETSTDYVLPETGGIGTNRFTAVGLALMAGSLLCGYVMRRKRRERRGN